MQKYKNIQHVLKLPIDVKKYLKNVMKYVIVTYESKVEWQPAL